jgi:hypothetical protein
VSSELDVYVATSGPYRMAIAASQIDSTAPCPSFELSTIDRPGVLGVHEGMRVIHPGWLWGEVRVQQPPQYLLVVRSAVCALAVDTCRLTRVIVDPPPPALAGSGLIFGLVNTAEGLMPVFDLACVPLA